MFLLLQQDLSLIDRFYKLLRRIVRFRTSIEVFLYEKLESGTASAVCQL